jgi:hypothetical protein
MKTSLAELREYKNEAVVQRFLETWDLPEYEAEELFEDMKKWLWLSVYSADLPAGKRIDLGFTQATKIIDEMWHTFILFTKEYHDFCERYFGRFVHHAPTPRSVYDQILAAYERDPEALMNENREFFAKQYELIYDVLGEQTLVLWYDEYHKKYTDEFLRSIWRWSFSPYDARVSVFVAD